MAMFFGRGKWRSVAFAALAGAITAGTFAAIGTGLDVARFGLNPKFESELWTHAFTIGLPIALLSVAGGLLGGCIGLTLGCRAARSQPDQHESRRNSN